MTRRIRLDIEIQELEEGSYQPVVLQKLDSSCGGVFQLRAGMSRRIKGNNDPSTFHISLFLFLVSTCPIQDCGQLPLVLGDIHGADIGSVLIDSPDYSEIKDPDSYQEKGL